MYRAYDPTHARWLNRDPMGEMGGLNLYAYVDGNPASIEDPSGRCPWCVVGGVVGAIQGYANGVASGDTGWTLVLDTSIGTLTGMASVGIEGFTLLATGARLAVNVGGEYLRQRGKGIQTGCPDIDPNGLIVAGLSSVAGDLAGELAGLSDALAASDALHYVPEASDNIVNAAGMAVNSIVNSIANLEQEALKF
jgi:hypothetical protein